LEKQEIKKLIAEARQLSSYEERLSFLRGKFVGEKCYILGCGPSLKDVDKNALFKEAENNVVMSIKQSFFTFKDVVDFHFFNTNNYKFYPDKDDAIYIGSTDWNDEIVTRASYWKLQQTDICTRVAGKILKHASGDKTRDAVNEPPMTKLQYSDHQEHFQIDFNLDNYTFEKTGLTRKWGAGIMYELVLYFAYHLGFSEIRTIGWDYHDPNSTEAAPHFYSEEARLKTVNPCLPAYAEEMRDSIELAKNFQIWLDTKGTKLMAHESESCFLSNEIERYKL